MKVIILLAGYGTRMRPHTWSRPKALMKVAGNTVIGHVLDTMSDILTEEVIFVVGYKGDQIEAWIGANYPELDAKFVVQENALGQAHAVWLCRDYLTQDGAVVVAFGDGVVRADYAEFTRNASDTDALLTVQEVEDPRPFGVVALDQHGLVRQFIEKPEGLEHRNAAAGINWFRSSAQLLDAIATIMRDKRQTKGEYYMADAYQVMLERGAHMRTLPVEYWLDAGKPEHILATNARLLGLGVGVSDDALERSYGEGFTVIPPVFIHETAEIDASVIGPYVHIDAGCQVSSAIIRNSIIDPGAKIANCVLDAALIGEDTTVAGHPHHMFIGDRAIVELG